VRKAAFKYNGVASFWGFLVAIPADVGVFDSKLSRTRTLVKGGRVMPKNVAWLRKHEGARRRLEKRNPRLKDDQIKAAMILARADFIGVHFLWERDNQLGFSF
jgi:hypothetical protein